MDDTGHDTVLSDRSRDDCDASSLSSSSDYLQPYTYSPLAENEIRVFYLHRSQRADEPLSGTLSTVQIPPQRPAVNEKAAYEALSYAWGPTYADGSHLTHFIRCDGRLVYVTSNLLQALKRLRAGNTRGRREYHGGGEMRTVRRPRWRKGEDRMPDLPLWIDAICINQRDVGERSLQVVQMHDIFQRAFAVTIWLGERPDGELGSSLSGLVSGIDESVERTTVETLLQFPWFHRRWVVQEVASAAHCGMRLGEWEGSYRAVYDHMRAHGLTSRAVPLYLRTRPVTLLQALFIYRDSESYDPLDRIYALRNISSDGWRVGVDYSRSVREVYVDLALTATVDETAVSGEGSQRNFQALPNDPDLLLESGLATEGFSAFSTIRPAEMLRLLVLATCFRHVAVEVPEDVPWESWVPDWRAKASFESGQHEEAVMSCTANNVVSGSEQDLTGLPDGIAAAESEHLYLHVRGLMFSRSTVGRCNKAIAQMLRNDALKPNLTLSDITEPHDVVWIPWFSPVSQVAAQERGKRGVGFVLQPGRTTSIFEGELVLRLRHCFLLSSVLSTADINSLASVAAISSQGGQTGKNAWEEFYLE